MVLVKLKPVCKHVPKNGTVTLTSDSPTPGHTLQLQSRETRRGTYVIVVHRSYTQYIVHDVPEVNCLEI